jgi:hypothetical protein
VKIIKLGGKTEATLHAVHSYIIGQKSITQYPQLLAELGKNCINNRILVRPLTPPPPLLGWSSYERISRSLNFAFYLFFPVSGTILNEA